MENIMDPDPAKSCGSATLVFSSFRKNFYTFVVSSRGFTETTSKILKFMTKCLFSNQTFQEMSLVLVVKE